MKYVRNTRSPSRKKTLWPCHSSTPKSLSKLSVIVYQGMSHSIRSFKRAMPACVNKDSPTDPQGVQAQCAASGRMSVCGFADVTACECVSGRCESDSSSSTLPAR